MSTQIILTGTHLQTILADEKEKDCLMGVLAKQKKIKYGKNHNKF